MHDIYLYKAVIRSVYDGDTVRVDIDLGFSTWIYNQSLRLSGIDTPEIRGDERQEGLVARDYVRSKVPVGSTVIIRTEKDGKGKYGRRLATILYGDDLIDLNEELVTEGLAERYS